MKKLITLLASLALVASGLHILPAAAAEEPPTVPDVVNIEDPYGDANTLGGDQVTPADGGSVSDIGKVWFSHDADNFNVHVLTEGPPGTNTVGIQFEVIAGDGGCAIFSGIYKGLTYLSDNYARLVDNCNDLDEPLLGTFTFGEGPDGSGLATITVPRSGSPLLADGSSITAPTAKSWIFVGGEQLTPSGFRGVRQPVDDTKAGTDYAIAGADKPAKTPPGKNDPPGKKKGCDNGKGKKRGCEGKGKKSPKPGKPAAGCAPFAPGERGADAETTVVTDAATEEAPLEITVATAAGLPTAPTEHAHNLQVDTASENTGLYVRVEFYDDEDLDLYLKNPDDSVAAQAAGFNPFPFIPPNPVLSTDGTGHGGHSEQGAEQVDGVLTADCGGYTAQIDEYFGYGGDRVVKVWLGPATWDPEAQAPIGQ